jgi:hypothetical protein
MKMVLLKTLVKDVKLVTLSRLVINKAGGVIVENGEKCKTPKD